MPAIEADLPPRLRSIQEEPICASRQEVVLPVDGAPLVYSTSYARKMAIRVTSAAGKTFDLPVEARADRGGYVLKNDRPIPAGLARMGVVEGKGVLVRVDLGGRRAMQ